ncbi:NUDIX hydrolase [Dehalococcoidia bacterium]|nr:NUDIX hydrolase [Dehalococcoidia bacterium]
MHPFKVIKTRNIFRGKILKVRVDTLDIGAKNLVEREVVEHPGAVVIAAIDDLGRVLLVRQFRHAAGEHLLELPAGTIEPGEEPLATAGRELREETGFAPGTIDHAGGFYTAPGFCDEYLHFFIARNLEEKPLQGDPDEDIEVIAANLDTITDLIETGAIKDAKSIAGLLRVLIIEQGKTL